MEIGVLTFGEITTNPETGATPTAQERIAETLEQARVADQVGLDVFGVGEHHREDFVASAPAVILAAAAPQTRDIRLASTVTVLSSDDPVRVYEQFATLDLISGGRAEVMAGRGSYTESFPLFGYSLNDYNELFAEKLELLDLIRRENPVSWTGSTRAALENADVSPRALQKLLPVWQAVGGTPASAVRAGRAGLPMMIAFLVGPLAAHAQMAQLYRAAAEQAGVPADQQRVGASVHGYVGATSQRARDVMYPYFARGMRENNHQRGVGFDIPRAAFDAQAGPAAMPIVGSPQEVIDKIGRYREVYGIDRVMIQMGFGGVPQREHLEAIELLGTEVAPALRREFGGAAGKPGTAERYRQRIRIDRTHGRPMSAPLRVVMLTASPSEESKTVALARLAVDEITRRWNAEVTDINVYGLGAGFTSAITRDDVDARTGAAIDAVEAADLLVVAVPVYRGSYPGIFKHFMDLVDVYGIAGTPTLLLATGGSERHSLVIDQVLRPLFGFFQAFVAPSGVYVAAAAFDGTTVLDVEVYTRLQVAVNDLSPIIDARVGVGAL